MKTVQLIVLVILVGAIFLVVNGLFSAFTLLELAWSTVLSLVNLF
jgi:cell shape-determining protein MreC